MQEKLFGKTLEELKDLYARQLGLPAYTGKQLSEWLYKKKITGFEEMTNLSKKTRTLLSSLYELGIKEPVDVQESIDGTKKYLFPSLPGKFIETAFIPDGRTKYGLCLLPGGL